MFLSPRSPTQNDITRRSNRKTKGIDRNHFAEVYAKIIKPKRRKIPTSPTLTDSEVQNHCAKLMSINSCDHEDYLLT
jgi:hypothetical protein